MVSSPEYALATYGLHRLYFLIVTPWIKISLASPLLESDAHFFRTVFVRSHVCREYHLRLTSGIDGNTLLLFISSGKCTRESDHGDGRLSGTSPQGRSASSPSLSALWGSTLQRNLLARYICMSASCAHTHPHPVQLWLRSVLVRLYIPLSFNLRRSIFLRSPLGLGELLPRSFLCSGGERSTIPFFV
jgi:hypothetical protein